MNIRVYTKALVSRDNTGTVTTFYNDGRREILSSDVNDFNGSPSSSINGVDLREGEGFLLVDENRFPTNVVAELNDLGELVLSGQDVDKYSLENENLIFTE